MPRDTNGNYTLPAGNPVAAGTTIEASWANTTMDDVAAALTDSLDRNGRGGMLAPFQFSDGTEASPGAQWANEPSSGLYRPGAGDIRMAIQGTDNMRWPNNSVAQVWVDGAWRDILYGATSGSVPDGTAQWQSLTWDEANSGWIVSSALLINNQSGAVSAATFVEDGTQLTSKYLGITATAVNSNLLDGLDSLWFLDSSNQSAGILPRPRLGAGTETYDIDITGSSGSSSGTAADSARLGGQLPSFYQDSSNQISGILPVSRLSAVTPYNIDTTGNAATATLADDATEAVNSDTVDNFHIVVTTTLPGTTDPNTLYFLTG